MKNALRLFAEGEYAVLKIEVEGKEWVELMRERLDSPFATTIEPVFIEQRINSKIDE